MIRECPLLIRMNDGREYYVEKPEFIHIGDYTAGLLVTSMPALRETLLHH
jgi:hypothetical protein